MRFDNVYGPLGTYDGGKENAPAAICRKVAPACNPDEIEVWGDGAKTRSFMYVDDCVEGLVQFRRKSCGEAFPTPPRTLACCKSGERSSQPIHFRTDKSPVIDLLQTAFDQLVGTSNHRAVSSRYQSSPGDLPASVVVSLKQPNSTKESLNHASYISSRLSYALVLSICLTVLLPGAMGQANVYGQWSTLPKLMPINPVHVALLSSGKVLVVAGSGNCPPAQSGCPSGPPYGPSNGSGALLLDPVSGQTIAQFSLSWDMFCNGTVLLQDGRVLIDSGTTQYDPFYGSPQVAIFDPATNTFSNTQNMAHGRWYPTVLTLGDGRVMAFSGINETGGTNTAVEFYTVGSGWSTEYIAPWTPNFYPRLHLLPNGKVFYSGWQTTSKLFDPSTTTWNTSVATTNYSGARLYGTSVLLPLTPSNNYDPKVIIMGGGNPATNTTEIIDMGASSPAWQYGPNMSQARIEMNAVILPNGKVLTLGGSANDEDTGSLSLNADLFDLSTVNLNTNPPNVGTVSSAGANATQRLYHSVALLLPDATVWVAGGNPSRGTYNNTMEIYQPPYLFNSSGGQATRPSISSAPTSISWGSQFTVQTPDAANISSVVLVRNGTVTHAFGMDQREVGMSFTVGSGTLTVTAPPNGNIAPPGYYMLFLLNSSGVPSLASFVKFGYQLPAAPTNLTATAGSGQVGLSWSASSGATSYNVKRSTTSGGPYTTIASPTTTSYTDTGVTNGTTYYYVVSGVNTAGESANSSQVSATPQQAVPAAPTNLTATAGSGQVGLSWSASSGATSYNVKRSTTSGGPYTTIASPTTTSYTDTGVTNGTTYYYVVSGVNTAGESANSSQVSATPTASTTVINYSSGFTATGLQLNGSTTLNGTRLRLTDGGASEASSVFYTTPVNIQSFTTNFSFQMTSAKADGMTFVIQNGAATALGGVGGLLGYGGMGNSVAVKFDIYNNAGEGTDSTGMYTNGANPTLPTVDMTSSGVILLSGDVMNAQLSYNGTTLTLTITDASTLKSFTTSWTVNIPTTVGGNTALVGFSGGTGGLTAIQDVLSWTYSTGSNTNPPAAPTNLTATAGIGQVGLSWSASSGATSYKVKRSTTSGGPYTTIASPTTTSYTDTGVTNGTTYYYVVSGVNTAGESANSSQVSATPQQAVPAAPTNLTATAGIGQVGLSWSASSGATSYKVKRSTTSGGPYTTIASPTTTSYTDTGVTNGTTYYYVVSGVNTAGESANSSQVSATPQQAVPAAPTNLTATAGSGQVGLSWSASSGATSYNVKRSTTSGGPYTTIASPTTTSYTDTGVTNGTTYYYVVSGVNTAGESANSSQVSATPTASTTVINYSSGFTATGLQLNGSTTLNGTRLRLTDGGASEASSVFYTTPVNIQSFTTNFSFQMTSAKADGMTFVIQNGAATALGGVGGLLGYGGMGNSVAVKFDIYNNAGEGTDSTGMYTNGANPTLPTVDMTSSGVILLSGDVMNAQLSYNGTTLTLTITDASTLKSFTTSWTVNIPTTVGGNTALVGFSGGTGGLTAIQDVLSWTYSTGSNTNPPAAPTNLTATAGIGQVGLSWSASSGATSYKVKRSTTSGGPYTTIASPTTTSYTDTGVTNGTTYYYVVSGVNTAGESANSSQVSATPQQAVPAAPTNLTATAGSGQVGLSWSASSGATSYNVKRSTTSGGPYTTIASPTTTSYTDTGVTNGTTYYYVVSGVNTAGESANSSQVSATPTASTTVINYSSGFTATGLQLNGSTTLNGTRLRLTDGGASEASSVFYTTPVNIQSFTTNFSFQMTSAKADGMTFVIQNGAATALGGVGGLLGYGGMGNSVAVKFDIYNNAGEGTDSTGMYTSGANPTVPAVDMTSSGVILLSGDVMNVQLSYDGTTLTLTITDASTLKSFTTSWTVNIPTTVGGNTALMGFTGGTGGLTAIQDVLSWTVSR